MCAAWRCGGLVFRLCCRMVFPPAAFFCLSGAYSRRGAFSSVLPPFSPAVLCFAAADIYCRGLCCFCFLPSDISAEIMAAFFGGRLLPLQRVVFRGFPKGRLLARKRWSFAARKDTFCTLKGHLLESGFSELRASPHGSRRGRAEPCLGRGHPEGVIRGVRRSEILLLFIVRNIKFCLKVNLCPDFVSYYLSVGSNVFA